MEEILHEEKALGEAEEGKKEDAKYGEG